MNIFGSVEEQLKRIHRAGQSTRGSHVRIDTRKLELAAGAQRQFRLTGFDAGEKQLPARLHFQYRRMLFQMDADELPLDGD